MRCHLVSLLVAFALSFTSVIAVPFPDPPGEYFPPYDPSEIKPTDIGADRFELNLREFAAARQNSMRRSYVKKQDELVGSLLPETSVRPLFHKSPW